MAGARRKLTAILSADVVSYPRLMGADEQATLDALNANRDVFRKGITDHDGRVVDTAGDSVLAIFDSVVEAVKCAIEVQREIETSNESLAAERRMQFRIGVNLGDVIEQDDGTIHWRWRQYCGASGETSPCRPHYVVWTSARFHRRKDQRFHIFYR